MSFRFQDRAAAGRILAGLLGRCAGQTDVVVLGLPRGGIPVAYEVARLLAAPLDVFLVRKLGVPGHEELAMGAIASGGICVLNTNIIESLRIQQTTIDRVAERERRELERRESAYRVGPPVDLRDRAVVLIDDGLATGATMRAAVLAVKQHNVKDVIVAVPVAESQTVEEFNREVARTVCARPAKNFSGVGQWYLDFAQTSDEEVRALLSAAAAGFKEPAAIGGVGPE